MELIEDTLWRNPWGFSDIEGQGRENGFFLGYVWGLYVVKVGRRKGEGTHWFYV